MVSKAEASAYKQEKMPQGLNPFEQIEYHCLYMIYNNFFSKIYNKDDAGIYKKSILKEIDKLKQEYDFGVKCFDKSAELFNNVSHCIAVYSKDRTLENADAIVNAFNSLNK